MKKTGEKSVNLGLKILTISAFILIFIPFNGVAAQSCGDGSCNTAWEGNDSVPLTPMAAYYNLNPYRTNFYSDSNPTSTVSSSSTNSNNTKTTTTETNTNSNQTANTTTDNSNINSANNLASNAIFGSNSFLPSGLVQWILFAILILLIVILVRRIFGAKEEYKKQSMKYE